MIFIALGANLPSARFGEPRATLRAALEMLAARGIAVRRRSSWYETAPVPPSGQPWFVNAVAEIATARAPSVILRTLHDIEGELGRVRGPERNAARAADLDLLDFNGMVSGEGDWPILPHPRLAARAFVVHPLAEIAPDWRHPMSGDRIDAIAARLPSGQHCMRMPNASTRAASGLQAA
jgi:2-amino-4-hydroxy-6-hydroxymethyldihydropteridine diphosphokinase